MVQDVQSYIAEAGFKKDDNGRTAFVITLNCGCVQRYYHEPVLRPSDETMCWTYYCPTHLFE